MIEANQAISSFRAHDPLADRRVTVIVNDARNALRLSSKRYDIIVSQPSHPWTAGASHLYTREFMSIAKDHLTVDGVFVQWMNTEFVDEVLLRSLSATLLAVFANVRVYQPNPGALFFLASDTKLKIEHQIAQSGRPLSEHSSHFARIGLNSVEDFVVSLAMDEEGLRNFAQSGSISSDNRNIMATNSRSRGDGLKSVDVSELFASYDPLLNNDSWVYDGLGKELNLTYIGSRLIHNGFALRAAKLTESIKDRSTALLIHAINLSHHGNGTEALEYLRESIRERPGNRQASYRLIKNRLSSLVSGTASEEINVVARYLDGVPKAVIEGWGYAARKNWLALIELEDELASSKVTDLWYPEATQLRIEWRTKVKAQGMERNPALEALNLIDRTVLIAPELDLYVLRAACGILMKDPHIFVESSRYVANFIELRLDSVKNDDYTITANELRVMQSRLKELSGKLKSGFVKPVKQRALDTLIKMNSLADKLETIESTK